MSGCSSSSSSCSSSSSSSSRVGGSRVGGSRVGAIGCIDESSGESHPSEVPHSPLERPLVCPTRWHLMLSPLPLLRHASAAATMVVRRQCRRGGHACVRCCNRTSVRSAAFACTRSRLVNVITCQFCLHFIVSGMQETYVLYAATEVYGLSMLPSEV